MSAIIVSNIGKAYKQYSSKWQRFAEWVMPFFGERHQLKWVLKDINFSVEAGEALGIIGINGTGKSTLLKMITGTVAPTEGSAVTSGRVAALLELGMGFHPDFTGRQNIYMAGQLMGLNSEELAGLMPSIENFAEVGDYFDSPIRVYSSGMQVRLAFAVATAIRPDVLIVDEALSVGDTYFQHKCFNRIRKFREDGTTLLIVSHDPGMIKSFCDRAILLDAGGLVKSGSPEEVLDYYSALLAPSDPDQITQKKVSDTKVQTVSGSGEASVTAISLLSEDFKLIQVAEVCQRVILRVEVTARAHIERLIFGFGIKDKFGQVIFGTNTHLKEIPLLDVKKDDVYMFDISFMMNLNEGDYSVQTSLASTEDYHTNNYEWIDLAFIFHVQRLNMPYFAGTTWIETEISINKKN
jgi:lipopolysaccharide transport system ATP-binding protein